MKKNWKLMMGFRDNGEGLWVFWQVVTCDDNIVRLQSEVYVEEHDLGVIVRRLQAIAPDITMIEELGYTMSSDEIFTSTHDGAMVITGQSGVESCLRLGSISTQIPLLILSFFQEKE